MKLSAGRPQDLADVEAQEILQDRELE